MMTNWSVVVQVEWVMPGKCADNSVMLPGFYMKKTTVTINHMHEGSLRIMQDWTRHTNGFMF